MKKKIYRKVEEVEEGRKEGRMRDQKLFRPQTFGLIRPQTFGLIRLRTFGSIRLCG
jgi:hypothetical protein